MTLQYTIQVGDECIVAPLSLFNTELLNITGPGKSAKVQKPARQQLDPEDCFDAEYLRETGVSFIFCYLRLVLQEKSFSISSEKVHANKWIKVSKMALAL